MAAVPDAGAPWWSCSSLVPWLRGGAATSAEGKLLQMLCTPCWEAANSPDPRVGEASSAVFLCSHFSFKLGEKVAVFSIR